MLKQIALFVVLFLSTIFYSNPVFAQTQSVSMLLPVGGSWQETSPFGYRYHPITGEWKGHTGVDLAADEGTTVLAAADGTVAYAGWMEGYGNTCIIDHGQGLTTLYGHMEDGSPTVLPGTPVTQGSPIGFVGSTGNSTGPHLHFEVRLSSVPTDPSVFCPEITAGSGSGSEAMDGESIPFNFDASFDFAKPIREAIQAIGDTCTKGFHVLKSIMNKLLMILITIDFAVALTFKSLDANGGEGLAKWFAYKVFFYAILIFLLFNWGDTIANLARHFFVTVGGMSMGGTEEQAGKIMSDPTDIVQKGMQIITPLFTEFNKFHGMADMITKMAIILPCAIFGIIMTACFLLIGIQIAMAYIEFYMVTLFGFTSFIFAGERHVRHYAANGLNGIFAASIKLLFFCMFSMMLQTTMQNITVSTFFSQQMPNQNSSQYATGANIGSIEDFMARIRAVETGGSSDPYNTPSDDGYGFGAYQISYSNWESWCEEAGVEPAPPLPWPAEIQDRVARHKMEIYYQMYGNWHDVALAWNGGGGAVGQGWTSTEIYWAKVCGARGSIVPVTVINFIVLFKLTLLCLIFVILGDRLSKMLMEQFGGLGFRFTNE